MDVSDMFRSEGDNKPEAENKATVDNNREVGGKGDVEENVDSDWDAISRIDAEDNAHAAENPEANTKELANSEDGVVEEMKGKIVDLEDKLNQRVTRIKDLEEQRKKGSRLEFKLREDIAELKEDLLHSKNELKAALDQANKDRRNLLQSHQRDDMVIRDLKRVLRSTTEAKKQLEGEVKESASLTTQLKAQLEDAKTQISELKQLAAKGSEDAIVQAPCQAPAAPRHLFRGATPAQTPTTTAPAVAAAAAAAADGDDIRVLWPTTRRLFGEAWDSAIHIRREFVEEWNRMNPGERYVTLTLFMVWLCAVMVLIYKNLMKWAQNSFETYVAEVVGQVLSARVVRAGLMDNWDERMIQRM